MHPDIILKGLRRELGSFDHKAFPERAKRVEAQVAANLKLERPVVKPGAPTTVVDHDAVRLAALRRELVLAPQNEKRVTPQIASLEKRIASRKETVVDEKPSAAEVEQRKQARVGRKVERATAAPGEQRGDEQGEKKPE